MKKLIILTIMCFFGYAMSIIEVKEIENYAIVSGMGIDYDTKSKTYEVTLEIYVQSEGSTTDISSIKISSKGKDLTEAVENFKYFYPEEPYLNHCGIVIIGKELAEFQILDTVNYLNHNPSIRSTVYLVVSVEDSAKNILTSSSEKNKIISRDLVEEMANNEDIAGIWTVSKFHHLANMLSMKYAAVLFPAIYSKEEKIYIDGACLFEEFRMKEYINKREVFTVQSTWGHIKQGSLTFDDFSFHIQSIKTKMLYKSEDEIELNIIMKIVFYDSSGEREANTLEGLEKLRNKAQEHLEKLFSDTINKYKNDLRMDPFGFIFLSYRTKPFLYKKNKDDLKSFLSRIKVECNIRIDVSTSGYTQGGIEE